MWAHGDIVLGLLHHSQSLYVRQQLLSSQRVLVFCPITCVGNRAFLTAKQWRTWNQEWFWRNYSEDQAAMICESSQCSMNPILHNLMVICQSIRASTPVHWWFLLNRWSDNKGTCPWTCVSALTNLKQSSSLNNIVITWSPPFLEYYISINTIIYDMEDLDNLQVLRLR